MATATATQVGIYKSRKYRVDWVGQTKYGRRAKLTFFDGSKTFWVDASAVTITEGNRDYGTGRNRRGGCRECGGPIVDAPHHRAMGGLCGSCAFDEYDM